jgi:acylphosphatase
MIRATVFFSGRVQGVGFRFSTFEIAKGFDVKGTVENCDDGRVKLVAEGEPGEIDRFLSVLEKAMAGKVNQMQRFDSEPSHAFENFSVVR